MTAFAVLALLAALVVPLAALVVPLAAVTATAQNGHCGYTNTNTDGTSQGTQGGPACCPNGEFGHWEWGGYAGQNLSFCEAPPYEPPATAPPPTAAPAAHPKKAAAAAKPTFTG